jgi:hypothetical protein
MFKYISWTYNVNEISSYYAVINYILNICVKNQEMHQLFIKFINQFEEQSIECCGQRNLLYHHAPRH